MIITSCACKNVHVYVGIRDDNDKQEVLSYWTCNTMKSSDTRVILHAHPLPLSLKACTTTYFSCNKCKNIFTKMLKDV